MQQNVGVKTDDYNFKLRSSGVIVKDDKVLLVRMDDADFLCLPGGYIELGEDSKMGTKRELEEEIGKEVKVEKYLGVVENFFINKYHKKMHEVAFYYLMSFVDNNIETKDFSLIEDDHGYKVKLDFQWIKKEDIDKYNVKPNFLKDLIKKDNLEINHLIVNDGVK